jgi:hypothetical protein
MNLPTLEADGCVLEWWAEHAAGLPNLSRMARQFLAAQATSAAVERLFSKAGLIHSDLRKSTSEEQIAHILMASINAE